MKKKRNYFFAIDYYVQNPVRKNQTKIIQNQFETNY